MAFFKIKQEIRAAGRKPQLFFSV